MFEKISTGLSGRRIEKGWNNRMRDVMECKGYFGSVHYNSDDEIFHGKIEGINDLVTFEGHSVAELKAAFMESVNDYIELCLEVGKKPMKSCKGSFNVRVTPALHREMYKKAIILGISLNQAVKNALESFLKS